VIDRQAGDRMLVALVGLLALVAGSYGLARGLGAFGARQSDTVLLGEDLRDTLAVNAGWVGGMATFVALLVAWLGWRWLRRQLVGSVTLRQVRLATGPDGHTTVDARAVADAVVRDLEAGAHVRGARARVVGHEHDPALELAVDLDATADLQVVRHLVEDEVLPRARGALERDIDARLRLRL
jgi:hypothetical protein